MSGAVQLSRLDLSGAQIENVVRKLTMMEVVEGKQSNFQKVLELANEEAKMEDSKNAKIGF